ncbi:MAG: class I SAM-dependent methyltransferase [Deltaproteobacteria bacterium]|nr:class I SAM-dependent methyltransferase [Deltaproteobacteria bacterium]
MIQVKPITSFTGFHLEQFGVFTHPSVKPFPVSPYEERYRAVYHAGGDRYYKREPNTSLHQFLSTSQIASGNVAVLGCGEGRNISLFASSQWAVFGLDLSPSALHRAYQDYRDFAMVKFICADVTKEVPDRLVGKLDLVIAIGLVHMLTDQRDRMNLYAIVMMMLKPGGYFFLESNGDLNADTAEILAGGKIEMRTIQTPVGEKQIPLVRLQTVMLNGQTMRNELEQSGLQVVSMDSGTFRHPDTPRKQIVVVSRR